MTKSYVTIAQCAWCNKELNMLMIDKRMRDSFEMHTTVNELCDDCKKQAIIMYDRDTKNFIGYLKKIAVMNEESLEKYKDTPVKSLVKINDGRVTFYDE